MTPTILAERARALTDTTNLTLKIVEESGMKRMKMNALLGVSRGSTEPAKLIVLTYSGAPKASSPIALVGKGITFDSGGISLKPADRMDEMKDDMGGRRGGYSGVESCSRLTTAGQPGGHCACRGKPSQRMRP